MAHTTTPADWHVENDYWRKNYSTRPYAGTFDYDYYEPGYRYGFESANRYENRSWNDVESDLERGWDSFQYRGKSTWQQVKDAVRDAWERARMNSRG